MAPERPLPRTGGGYPHCAAAVRAVDPYDRKELVAITLRLSADPDARARGVRVVELIRDACLARHLDRVSILHMLFRNVVCRVPEFHVFMHEVLQRNDRTQISTLFNLPRRGRGRRPGDRLFFTALLEHVINNEGYEHVTDAAVWLDANREALDLPEDFLPSKKALLNQHAYLSEYFQLWSSCIFVEPELLTMLPPELPGHPHTQEMIEQARFPPSDGSTWPHGFLVEIRNPRQ